jgi:GNAT superfamily N-acetyltransferase
VRRDAYAPPVRIVPAHLHGRGAAVVSLRTELRYLPTMIREWARNEFTISTDPRRLDLDVVHGFLVRSYWAEGIPRDVMERSIASSLPFGLYDRTEQVGFARVLTDWAVFAMLMDVYVHERCRGQGLGKWLVEVATSLPEFGGLRCFMLRTVDAHELYRRFGFGEPAQPEVIMERLDPAPGVYRRGR